MYRLKPGARYVRLSTCMSKSCVLKPVILNGNSLNGKREFSMRTTIDSLSQTQMTIFKTLSESTPVAYVQDFLLNVHSYTGVPWWASIIISTVIVRSCVTLPLAIYQNYILAKVENLQLEMPELVEELKKETAIAIKKYNLTEHQAKHLFMRSLKKQYNNLIIRDNCHPFKASLLMWIQLPMWVCLSVSLRNLVYMLPNFDISAQVTCAELMLGGFGWIPNLIVPDTSLILPITLGIVNLSIIEIQTMSKLNKPTKLQKYATNFFRGITLVLVPISATVPSCICLYWTTSSVYGLFQNLLLMSPKFKRLSGVPKTASEKQHPYIHLINGVKSRLGRRKVENVS